MEKIKTILSNEKYSILVSELMLLEIEQEKNIKDNSKRINQIKQIIN